jgi:hypothetical protein
MTSNLDEEYQLAETIKLEDSVTALDILGKTVNGWFVFRI